MNTREKDIMQEYIADYFAHDTDAREKMSYTIKRTQRYVSAVHLATRHIGQNEPLGARLRVEAVAAVWFGDIAAGCAQARPHVAAIVSLLEVATVIGMISSKNADLLRRESQALLGLLRHLEAAVRQEQGDSVRELFCADDDSRGVAGTPDAQGRLREYAARANTAGIRPTHQDGPMPDLPASRSSRGRHAERILAAVPSGKQCSISDIRNVVPDISSKTLQRELAFLVAKKALNKAGSRRWSTYTRMGP